MVKKSEIFILSADSTLESAANTLFIATQMAEKINDAELIMNVVAGWLELYARLTGQEQERLRKIMPIGFSPTKVENDDLADAESDIEVEVDDGTDESDGECGIHS